MYCLLELRLIQIKSDVTGVGADVSDGSCGLNAFLDESGVCQGYLFRPLHILVLFSKIQLTPYVSKCPTLSTIDIHDDLTGITTANPIFVDYVAHNNEFCYEDGHANLVACYKDTSAGTEGT